MAVKSQKTVYQAKYFRIVQKELERDGKSFTKDFIERSPSVFILPIDENDDIYLESQYRDAFQKTVLEVVAGTMEIGGDPLETAKRELLEETGLIASEWKHLASWELSVNMNSPVHIFAASGLTKGQAQTDEDEEIELLKMPFATAVEKAVNGEFISSVHVAALLLYDKLREEQAV